MMGTLVVKGLILCQLLFTELRGASFCILDKKLPPKAFNRHKKVIE